MSSQGGTKAVLAALTANAAIAIAKFAAAAVTGVITDPRTLIG